MFITVWTAGVVIVSLNYSDLSFFECMNEKNLIEYNIQEGVDTFGVRKTLLSSGGKLEEIYLTCEQTNLLS